MASFFEYFVLFGKMKRLQKRLQNETRQRHFQNFQKFSKQSFLEHLSVATASSMNIVTKTYNWTHAISRSPKGKIGILIVFFIYCLFYLLFRCYTTNSAPLSKGQLYSARFNYCILSIFDPKATASLKTRLAPKARSSA